MITWEDVIFIIMFGPRLPHPYFLIYLNCTQTRKLNIFRSCKKFTSHGTDFTSFHSQKAQEIFIDTGLFAFPSIKILRFLWNDELNQILSIKYLNVNMKPLQIFRYRSNLQLFICWPIRILNDILCCLFLPSIICSE